jgi:reversibly glycosylated polypeptide/UDP-arabinopyranose mutase
MSQKIAVVVPTIRPESWELFFDKWIDLFKKHNVVLFKVDDSKDYPICYRGIDTNVHNSYVFARCGDIDNPKEPKRDWLFNKTDGCRNLGFYWAEQLVKPDIFISLDDDVYPVGDPIQDHINALSMSVSPTWMSTAQDWRVRGIPVGGEKWPVMLSHGVWNGVPDFDAPTQFLNPDIKDIAFNKTSIPKGALFPLCAMNFAFRRELMPYVYQAPMGKRLAEFDLPIGDRFADIWSGVVLKRWMDTQGFAAVTGYATIYHSRASNVFANLQKESVFLQLNEDFDNQFHDPNNNHPYVVLYRTALEQWQAALK